jgi:hypothetical protein
MPLATFAGRLKNVPRSVSVYSFNSIAVVKA